MDKNRKNEINKAYKERKFIFYYDRWLNIDQDGFLFRNGLLIKNPCCYVIYLDDVLSYIGSTNSLFHRICQHQIKETHDKKVETNWGIFNKVRCKVYYPSKYGYEAMLEKRLIRKLKPRFNKKLTHQRSNGYFGKKINNFATIGIF